MDSVEVTDKYAAAAWIGLCAYILVVDVGLGITGHEYMTTTVRRALKHPRRRWLVAGAGFFTIKHLYFGNFLPFLDPFAVIALLVGLIKKLGV